MPDAPNSAAPDPIQSPDAFLRMVLASGLVAPGRMAEVESALAGWRKAGGPMTAECVQELVDRRLLTDWQIGKLRDGKSRGFLLGKCKLLQPLGHGGMGSVYLAEHTTLGSKMAVKVLPRRRSEEKGSSYLERFEREARAAARLNHPNIARAQDLDSSEDGNHFIVMEYIDGIDLEKRVKGDGPLAVREAADFIRQAALGLEYAHEEGLVHRDIKPANLMVDTRGHLKILDLGLVQVDARQGVDDASITQTHEDKVMGTPDYMSPEQALGQRATPRSDIYSLGCTFYYLLSGQPPFERVPTPTPGVNKRKARMQAHVKEPAPNLLEVRSDAPAAIADLILRMMEKAPDARPQSAQEIASSLATWLAATAAPPARGRQGGGRRPAPRRSRAGAATSDVPVQRGSTVPGTSGSSSSPDGPIRGGTASDSESGIRYSGSGSHSSASPPVVPWTESDIHSPSQSDAHQPSSSARSTGRVTGTVPDGITSRDVGNAIVIDTAAKPVVVALQPPAVASVKSSVKAVVAGRTMPAWLTRRVAGLPLAAWLACAAALVAVVLVATIWWLAGGPANVPEDESEADLPTATAAESTDARSEDAAPADQRAEKSRKTGSKARPKKASEKSSLDMLYEPNESPSAQPSSGR